MNHVAALNVSKLCLGWPLYPVSCFLVCVLPEKEERKKEFLVPGTYRRVLSSAGTMTFGEQNCYEDAQAQLNLATESGINFLDTAEMYPVPQRAETQGLSEIYVGRWLKEGHISRDRVVLATKDHERSEFWSLYGNHFVALAHGNSLKGHKLMGIQATGPSGQMTWIRGGPPSLDARNIEEAINGSLKRLGTDYIDLYQLHWPDRYVPMFGDVDYDPAASYSSIPIEEQLKALSRAKEAGKIRYIGVSNETPYGVMEFCRLADSNAALPRIVTIQNAYCLLCRTFDSTLAECCHHQNVSLLAYSPLAMGLLSGKYLTSGNGPEDARLNLYRGRYAEAECRYSFSKPNCTPAVKAYVDIGRRHGISPVALAIGFVLRNSLVLSAVIGATKLWQLEEIIEASQVNLNAELLAEINMVHERFPNPTP
ncbi:hypothetical protein R1flu_029314 [Riccia fluitans]|uniref:NADP-dependent oxidoreductase domain-containing protein n=1 Tax=Riccia fluitans TaxID=41844 RepID=A0ABD1XS15_9MARC